MNKTSTSSSSEYNLDKVLTASHSCEWNVVSTRGSARDSILIDPVIATSNVDELHLHEVRASRLLTAVEPILCPTTHAHL